jgi:hypothetical protein
LAGLAVLAAVIWRRPASLLPVSCAALAWFFLINKVYSSQYGIWVVVMLALAAAPIWLAAGWAIADTLFFAATYPGIGLPVIVDGQFLLVNTNPFPSIAVRAAVLVLIVGWGLWRAWTQPPQWDRRTFHGDQPAAI